MWTSATYQIPAASTQLGLSDAGTRGPPAPVRAGTVSLRGREDRHRRLRPDPKSVTDCRLSRTCFVPHDLHFAYRVFDEIVAFQAAAESNKLYDDLGGAEAAFDAAVLMKVLPKFHGSRSRLERPLCEHTEHSPITMNRVQQIQRWRRYRRAKGGPRIGRWLCWWLRSLSPGECVGRRDHGAWGPASRWRPSTPTSPRTCPTPRAIQTQQATYETVKIYDRTGEHLLYESIDPRPFRGDRTYLPIDQIPELMRDATIALEDRTLLHQHRRELPGHRPRVLSRTCAARASRAAAPSPSSWSRTS